MIIRYEEDLANIMPVTTELPMAPMVATARPVPAQYFLLLAIFCVIVPAQVVNNPKYL